MKKIAFIVNPISGGSSSKKNLGLLENYATANDIQVYRTERQGHARDLAARLKDQHQTLGVFGGDGTINEVASELINHPTTLGIIPGGSGNGLAHHLNIPLETDKALDYLDREPGLIDTIKINNEYIINVGGLGFDGHVARLFNESESRGLFTYARIIVTQLITFKEQFYTINLNGQQKEGRAFMIAFANGSEFGNRFKIDPQGNATDGKFSLVIVRKPPFTKLIPLIIDGFRGKLKESVYYKRFSLEELFISSPGATLHRDGEVYPGETADQLNLTILNKSLRVHF